MPEYGYNPTLLKLWRLLTSSFSLGSWFGVHVRMRDHSEATDNRWTSDGITVD